MDSDKHPTNDMPDSPAEQEKRSLFERLWNAISLVLSFIPGVSFFLKRGENVVKGAYEVVTGDMSRGMAVIGGVGREYDILHDEYMGTREKSVRISSTVMDDVGKDLAGLAGGKLAEAAVVTGVHYTTQAAIRVAQKSDEDAGRKQLEEITGPLTEQEWQKKRQSLDTNDDNRVDPVEFARGFKTLRENAQCFSFDENQDRAPQLLINRNSRNA